MKLLIKNVLVVYPGSPHHGNKTDIFIQNGIISQIGNNLKAEGAEIMEGQGLSALPGLFDLGTMVGDPGFEHREDFESVSKAAIAGGFTAIACLPNTLPAIHSKSEVTYVKNHSKNSPVEFYPIGAVSYECKGKDITEIYDMQASGAIAFSDGKKPIQDSGLMMRALQYVQPFDGVILNQALDKTVAPGGQMHEGIVSTSLGMKGIPAFAEELMIRRDIYLAEYTNSRLHLLNISTAGAVALVKEAKSKGLKVTASVAVMNLVGDDSQLEEFDSNYKVMPPLRSKSDAKALQEGLKDGTIDCITSNHTPLDEESKNLEFPYADFGAIGLETAFALTHTQLGTNIGLENLVQNWAFNPRLLLKLPIPELREGAVADLMIFDPNQKWTFTLQDINSKSINTPFIGRELKGRVEAVIRNRHIFIRNNN